MNKYKRYIPIAAVVLAALGFNLDHLGIDLEAVGRGESIFGGQNANSSASTTSSNSAATTSTNNTSNDGHSSGQKWSDTNPNVNLLHIFEGEINRRGKPTGFHSRPNGQDPANARVTSVKDKPNRYGVYTANIEVRDGNEWKSKFSSFFPDDLSRNQVIDVILHAYSNSNNPNAQPWEGPSGAGYRVQGYTSGKGGINTAFPVFTRN